MWRHPVPDFGNLPLIVFTAVPAPKQFRRLGGFCQVTAPPLAGVDEVRGGHPSGYREQDSKMGEGPAQSWLGFWQETEPLEVMG